MVRRRIKVTEFQPYLLCRLDDDSLRRFWEIEDYNLQEPVLFQKKIVMEHFNKHHTRDEEEDLSSRYLENECSTRVEEASTT